MVKKKAAPIQRGTAKVKAKEVAKAEAFIDEKVDEAKTRVKRKEPWGHVTKDAILEARDGLRLSWRDVANKLDLGSPSTARKAYTALTGKAHNTSAVVVKRAPNGVGEEITGKRKAIISRPEWDDWTLDETVTEAITGRILIVDRKGREDELHVTTGMESLGAGGRKGLTQWKNVKVLQHGIRTRNSAGEPVPPYFCFTEAGTTNARIVAVEEIIAIR